MGLLAASSRHPVPLSLSLPSLRRAHVLTAEEISHALQQVHDFFYALPTVVLDVKTHRHRDKAAPDSGYVSEAEFDEFDAEGSEVDEEENSGFDCQERDFAIRWLSGLIGYASELAIDDESACEHLIDVASSLLSQLTNPEDDSSARNEDEDPGIIRRFDFSIADGSGTKTLSVDLHDSPMQTGDDHTDVGLQTWGASMVMSQMICDSPEAFGFKTTPPSSATPSSGTRILELGAGTGLVSLLLSTLLSDQIPTPTIIATDYHPTVLLNLEANASTHHKENPHTSPILVTDLDWRTPKKEAPLDRPADIILAADVAYAPEHALWLRDCAGALLAPSGVFWLMVSVRPNGKFADISDSVDAVFVKGEVPVCGDGSGKVLTVLSVEDIEKQRGVGRADEVGYKMFRIGWV